MRYNVQGIARDSYGKILPYEDISIFINNTESCATIYNTKDSIEKLNTCPQIQTDERGIFNIFFDSEDYEDLTTTFDLQIGKQKFKYVEPFKVDKRVLNTTDREGESVAEATENFSIEEYDIDGGTF